MEQTVQELSSSDPTSSGLALIAAAGTIVSLITLVLTALWRWRDSRIRVTITFVVRERPDGASPTQGEGLWIGFKALNSSRTPLYPAEAYLQANDGKRLQPMYQTMPGWGADVLQPGSPAMYYYSMGGMAEFVSSEGGRETASLTFVVCDGTGKRHEQGLMMRDIGRWVEGRQGREPLKITRPWWRRLLAAFGLWVGYAPFP